MLQDFHLHTIVSDGDVTPADVLFQAASRKVTHLSITDHDALGAYRWENGVVFGEARRLGLELTVGIEMDADMDGTEVHVLGLDIGLDEPRLNDHIERVRQTRFERARREIGIVNGLLGEGTITEEMIFVPGRETLMKPHFIHPLLDAGRFETYEEANGWYRKNVKSGVAVPKPPIGEVIELIHGAGGWAALAHPGYYDKAGVPMVAKLGELRRSGLDGVELDYPYFSCSPRLFSPADEQAFVGSIRTEADRLGLRVTRGSDCHTIADFDRVYGPTTQGGS